MLYQGVTLAFGTDAPVVAPNTLDVLWCATERSDPDAHEPAYEVRAFTTQFEDPVTGSFNGGAAQFMRSRNLVPARYTATQGTQNTVYEFGGVRPAELFSQEHCFIYNNG